MTERQPVYAEIPGCALFPVTDEAVSVALDQIAQDPFGTGREGFRALLSNPILFKMDLLSRSLVVPPIDFLYREGLARGLTILDAQADLSGFQIPTFNHVRGTGVAHQIVQSNNDIIINRKISSLEELFGILYDMVYQNNEAFAEGVNELTQYSYYGDSVGIGAIDVFRFAHEYLAGKPVNVWWGNFNLN